MRKHFSLASIIAAVSFICGGFVCTSCSEQQAIAPEPKFIKGDTEYITETVTKVIDNIVVWDGEHILYNGATALTASVAPDSLTLIMPAEQHKASDIADFLGDNRWTDTNGNAFTGTLNQTKLEGLELTASINPAAKFSTLTKIHDKVSMVKAQFMLEGMATLTETGKSKSFSLPVQNGTYFLCDTSVAVRVVNHETIKIEYKDSIVVKDSIIYQDRVEYIRIDKDATVVSGFGYGSILFAYGDKSFSFRFDLDKMNILRQENEWGIAAKESESRNGFNLSDTQIGKYTVRENGISLESVNFSGVSFIRLNDTFQYGTANVTVVTSYNDENGTAQTRTFTVGGSYLHELEAKAEPEVVTPEVVTEHTYDVDTVRVDVKDSEGNLTGKKMRVTIKRDGEVVFKGQYMACEWGLMTATLTGTQVGEAKMLRNTSITPEAYNQDGWSGTEDLKGATLTATAKQFKMRTAFPKVQGFNGSEESVAESNIIFGTRNFYWKDAETNWSLTITEGEMQVKVVEDEVTFNEAAKNEVNNRGLEYIYIGSHKLTVEQYVGGQMVNVQSREEYLLSPKN